MTRVSVLVAVILVLVTASVAQSVPLVNFSHYGNTYYYNPVPGSLGVSTFYRDGWVTVDDEKTGNIRVCFSDYSEYGTVCQDNMNHVPFFVEPPPKYYGIYQLTTGVIRYEGRTYLPLISR